MEKLTNEQKEAVRELCNLWAAKGEIEPGSPMFEYCPNHVIDGLLSDRIMELELLLGLIEVAEVPHVD